MDIISCGAKGLLTMFVRLSKAWILLYIMGVCVTNILAVETSDTDRIVAIVNDNIIVLSELDQALEPYRERLKTLGYSSEKEQEMLYEVREKVLDQLIDDELRDQEIAKNEISVEDKEVDDAIERVKIDSRLTDEELREALAQEGLTLEAYAESIREDILRARLVNLKVRSQIIITMEDTKSYYERNKDKYGSKTKYHLRHILMKPSSLDDETRNGAIREDMQAVLGKLREGQPFESLATTYSESPTADSGGDLGVFKLDTLSSRIKEAVAALKPGEFTSVIDTDQGYQIFMLQDIIEEPGIPLEDVRSEIDDTLYNEIISKKYDSWIETLRKQAHIKIIR